MHCLPVMFCVCSCSCCCRHGEIKFIYIYIILYTTMPSQLPPWFWSVIIPYSLYNLLFAQQQTLNKRSLGKLNVTTYKRRWYNITSCVTSNVLKYDSITHFSKLAQIPRHFSLYFIWSRPKLTLDSSTSRIFLGQDGTTSGSPVEVGSLVNKMRLSIEPWTETSTQS